MKPPSISSYPQIPSSNFRDNAFVQPPTNGSFQPVPPLRLIKTGPSISRLPPLYVAPNKLVKRYVAILRPDPRKPAAKTACLGEKSTNNSLDFLGWYKICCKERKITGKHQPWFILKVCGCNRKMLITGKHHVDTYSYAILQICLIQLRSCGVAVVGMPHYL